MKLYDIQSDYIYMTMSGKLPTLVALSPGSALLSKQLFSSYLCMYILNVRWMLSNFGRYHFQVNVDTATKEKRRKIAH